MNTDLIRNPQIIKYDDRPAYAVVPLEEYRELLIEIEDYLDLIDARAIHAQIEAGEMELIPAHVVYALVDGQNPIKVWREFRGMTQTELARQIGIGKAFMSQIESGSRSGDKQLAKIAAALNVDLDDLTPRKRSNDE